MKKWLFVMIAVCVFSFSVVVFQFSNIPISNAAVKKVYTLEMNRWGIYNDGTHPNETTKGINEALIWANQNGYDSFIVPNGTYLISKDSSIKMVSNITFELKKSAILQKESNLYWVFTS